MSDRDEREILVALLGALERRELAAALRDDAKTLAVARRHRLTPLLSAHCRAVLPPGLADACRRDHLLTTARNIVLSTVAEEALNALAASGISAALLKGLAYEQTLYEQGGARPMGDIDLLVRDADRRKAFTVLDHLGFEPKAAAPGFDDADYHEVAWRRADVEIDLHMALAPYVRCAIDYDAVWRDMGEIVVGRVSARVLSPTHAAIFHALHMAIDHFDVPGLYLLDLARLLPTTAEVELADVTARAWRCHRPLTTSLALTAAFQPAWAARPSTPAPKRALEVMEHFGGLARLPRSDQLRRKVAHFDTLRDVVRYTVVQGRRHARETVERRVLRRSPRARLGLSGAL